MERLRKLINSIYKYKIVFILWGLVFALFLFFSFYSFYFASKNKIFYRIYIAGQLLSGKDFEGAKESINQQIYNYLNRKLIFIYKDKYLEVPIAQLIKYFDCEKMARISYQKGREENFLINQKTRLFLLIIGANVSSEFILNENGIEEIIKKLKSELNVPFQEALIQIEEGKIFINQAKEGLILDEDGLRANINYQLINFKNEPINVPMKEVYSELSEEELQETKERVEKIITTPLILNYQSIAHRINPQKIGEWIKLELRPWDWNSLNNQEKLILDNYLIKIINLDKFPLRKGEIEIILNEEKVKDYLKDFAQKYIDINPQNAVLKAENGKLIIVKPEINGRSLDIEDTYLQIKKALLENGPSEIELTVSPNLAEVRSDNYLELGIRELIGTGYSNFTGSPQNRIHNITLGANKVNGSLIKPGEAFSLNQAIGPVDAESGFLPELVIKENKTVPEYGGGLCQIGTTCFRAALNSALPILERKNHAYIVQYYYPIGTDATIYPPHPDVIFLNDTPGYILIQTRIEGNYLYFDFYGTKGDKRCKFNGNSNLEGAVDNVENVTPNVYNQKEDGSAEAEFYRFIFEQNKLIKTERYYSYYESPSKYPH